MDAPFHIQSLLRAPTGHKAGLPGVRGPGAPLPSELQAWGRKDMTTKNLSEGQQGKEGWAIKFIQKDAEGDHGGVEGVEWTFEAEGWAGKGTWAKVKARAAF